jgi:hypothetical protein
MDTLFQLPAPTNARPGRRGRGRAAGPAASAAGPRAPAAATASVAPARAPGAAPARRARTATATGVVALRLEPLPLWLAQRRDPTLARTPAAVVQDGRVLHANPPARRLGVSRGMRIEGAKLRAEHLVTLAPSPVDLEHAWRGVLRDLAAWTPWLSARRQGLALLRATPREAAELAEAFEGRVGVAADRQTAELAAAAARPGTVRRVAPDDEAAFLSKLPLRFLRAVGLGDADLTRLHWLGLATAGDLARWSREQLEGYLGDTGRALLPYLHGPRDDAMPSWAPPAPLRRRLAFDRPLFEPFELEGAIDHLAHALARALRGDAAKRLTLIAEVGGVALPASRLAKRPMHAPEQIRRQALLALSDSGAAPVGVEGLTLELDERARLAEQEGLWATRTQRARAQEAVLARFPASLRTVRWSDPHAPAVDHAWSWVPVDAADDAATVTTRAPARADARSRTPTATPATEARGERRDDAVPLFAAAGEHPVAIVLRPPAAARRRTAAAAGPDPARQGGDGDADRRDAPTPAPPLAPPPRALATPAPLDLAALEIERTERWPGERGRLTNRVLRAA